MGRRRHIKGLDKPSAGPLRFEADPLVSLAKQASAHEIHRLDSVAETMILVGVMAGKKVLAGHEMVTVGPAEPQLALACVAIIQSQRIACRAGSS